MIEKQNKFFLLLRIEFVPKKDNLKVYFCHYYFQLYEGVFTEMKNGYYLHKFIEKYRDEFIIDLMQNEYKVIFKIKYIDIYENEYWIDENEDGIHLKEHIEEKTSHIVLSEERKKYKYIVYNDITDWKKGANVIKGKCYDVMFDFEFPLKVFAVPHKEECCKNKVYSFYELSTGRLLWIGSIDKFGLIYTNKYKNKNDYKEIVDLWKNWKKDTFEENEYYFKVYGRVN